MQPAVTTILVNDTVEKVSRGKQNNLAQTDNDTTSYNFPDLSSNDNSMGEEIVALVNNEVDLFLRTIMCNILILNNNARDDGVPKTLP